MNRILAAIACLAFFASSALAATTDERYVIKGAGNGTCERFVTEREAQSQSYALFGGWLAGYITAYNQLTDETFDIAPWQNLDLLAAFLDNFCRQNPDLAFVSAVGAMISALQPTRLRTASEKIEAAAGDDRVTLFRNVLRDVQIRLTDLGHYQSGADGLYGEGTRRALEEFQKSKALPPTGLPDQRTLFELYR